MRSKTILCPALAKLLTEYPDITIEIIVDYGLDIKASMNCSGTLADAPCMQIQSIGKAVGQSAVFCVAIAQNIAP